jgi:glycoside/pentoside/hexuronide:cation symporter, GPH family
MQDESQELAAGGTADYSMGKAAVTMQAGLKKLSLGEKVGFSLGDAASNIYFQTLISFGTIFYTDVFGLSTKALTWMFLGSKIWDAVNDPIMGMIADRTQTRWGKFRPFLLWFAIPFGVVGALAFTTPGFGATGKLIYAVITYNLLLTLYTVVNVPYCALMGVMTPDSNERTVLSSYRFFAAFFATLLVQFFALGMVKRFGGDNPAVGWQWTMAILSAIAVVLFFITFATTRERVHPPKGQKTPMGQDLAGLFTNLPWILIAAATVFQLFFYGMRGGAVGYYIKYFVFTPSVKSQSIPLFGTVSYDQVWSAFLVTGTVTTIIGILLATRINRVLGKALTYALSLGVAGAASGAVYFLRTQDVVLLFILQIVTSFCMGPLAVLQWAIFTDVADFGEWKNRRRSTALIMAASLFALKLGLAVGSAALVWILGRYGYVENVDQTPQALTGIRMVTSVYPAVFAVLAMLFMFFYPLNKTRMAEVQSDLIERRKQSANG